MYVTKKKIVRKTNKHTNNTPTAVEVCMFQRFESCGMDSTKRKIDLRPRIEVGVEIGRKEKGIIYLANHKCCTK